MRSFTLGASLLTVMLASACTNGSQGDLVNDVGHQLLAELNLNGEQLNGQRLNGQRLNGQRLNGTASNGQTINNVQVGTNAAGLPTLLGFDDLSNPVTGNKFVGATIWAQYSDGTSQPVYITGYDNTSEAPFELYLVVDSGGNSVCGNWIDGSILWASVISETFDPVTGIETDLPGLFTFACMHGAILKSELYGYPMDTTYPETYNGVTVQRSLNPYHAASTHMIMADYCGDGQTHTLNNTTIDIRDNLGIELDTTTGTTDPTWGPWYTETEWAPDGAYCLNKTRWMPDPGRTMADNHNPSIDVHWAYVLQNCPWRIAGYNDGVHPVRPCGAQSTYLPQNGFSLADQTQRSLLGDNTPLRYYNPTTLIPDYPNY